MARPSKLAPTVRDAIITSLRAGACIETAAATAGVASSTVHSWIRRAEDHPDDCGEPFLEFLGAYKKGSFALRVGRSAREYWFVAAEVEHGEGDEGVGGFEAEGDAGDQSDSRVDGFDSAVGEFVFDRGEDRGAVFDDAALEFHERGDAVAPSPGDPFVEGFGGFIVGEFEDHSEAFFEAVGATESRVGLHDPGELDLLVFGEVFWVLPEGVVRVLQAGRLDAVGARWCIDSGAAEASPGFVLAGGFAVLIPRVSAHFVEGVGGPY